MKYLFIILLLACSQPSKKGNAEFIIDSAKGDTRQLTANDTLPNVISGLGAPFPKDTIPMLWSSGAAYVSIGYSEGKVSIMMRLNDSTISINGDSMAVIKMLWKRLEEANERNSDLWRQYGKMEKTLIDVDNEIERMKAKIK